MAEPKGCAMAPTTNPRRWARTARHGLALPLLAAVSCATTESTLVMNHGPTTTESGEFVILTPSPQTFDVYYPIPFASPPNLQLAGDTNDFELVEQQADHFTVRRRTAAPPTVHWRAEGKPHYGPPPPPPAVLRPVVIEPAPPPETKLPPPRRVPELPPEPIPVKP
jgi:hypothetical protein